MSYAGTKVLSLGGSRNIGYFSALRLLAKGATVTFLLRKPSVFAEDDVIQKYVKDGKARLLKGDTMVKTDVANAWVEAAKGDGTEHVDILLFSIGTIPDFSLTKGFVQTPANLVTQSLLNALTTLPKTAPQPKIITLSSTGLTKKSHVNLPLLLKPLYSLALAAPHRDKVGAERVVAHCAGWEWDVKGDGEVGEDIMGKSWQDLEGLPAPGSLKNFVVLRPALLMNDEAKGDKPNKGKEPYRVQEGDIGGYIISRKDVAHFIVEGALGNWDKWRGKIVNIAY